MTEIRPKDLQALNEQALLEGKSVGVLLTEILREWLARSAGPSARQ